MPRNLLIYICLSLSFSLYVPFHLNAKTFTVTHTGDQGDASPGDGNCDDGAGNCTLRAAIEEANRSAGFDIIEFSIPGDGPHVFQPAAKGFPQIIDPLKIDGTSEAGYTFTTPMIVIDGSNSFAGSIGIEILTDGCEIRGLVIGGFVHNGNSDGGIGIRVFSASNNLIASNFIGVAPHGTAAFANTYGIKLDVGATNNLIGGISSNDRNLISGNDEVGLLIDMADRNFVRGNMIGTDLWGVSAVPNETGILISNSSQNEIGASFSAFRNIISGNEAGGIDIHASNFTSIYGNYIGTNAAGFWALPNDYGIYIKSDAKNNQIGARSSDALNLISGNMRFGMEIWGNNNVVEGNIIGAKIWGNEALPNGPVGIDIIGGSNNTIGGEEGEAGNIIAFHTGEGVRIRDAASNATGNRISRNRIFGNANIGIDIGYGASSNTGLNINDTAAEDADSGPNNLQNYAEITDFRFNLEKNAIELSYFVPTNPMYAQFPLEVEFFVDNGQDQLYIGGDNFNEANYKAAAAKSIRLSAPNGYSFSGSELLMNMVTDADGNSSELSLGILPLAIASELTASLKGDVVLLEWLGMAEPTEIFVLERATDQRTFEPIGEVEAKDGSALEQNYSFTDLRPMPGSNSYRVKTIDWDGKVVFSSVVEVLFDPAQLIEVFPNPATSFTSLHIKRSMDRPMRIFLRDIQGRIIKRWVAAVDEDDMELHIEWDGIGSGVYILHAILDSGHYVKQKLIIQ